MKKMILKQFAVIILGSSLIAVAEDSTNAVSDNLDWQKVQDICARPCDEKGNCCSDRRELCEIFARCHRSIDQKPVEVADVNETSAQ